MFNLDVLISRRYKTPKDYKLVTSDNVPRFITKKWIEFRDQSGNAEENNNPSNK